MSAIPIAIVTDRHAADHPLAVDQLDVAAVGVLGVVQLRGLRVEPRDDRVRERGRVLGRNEDGEVVLTQVPDERRRSGDLSGHVADDAGRELEHLIPAREPVAVVVVLHPGEVAHQQRERLLAFDPAVELGPQPGVTGQPRERRLVARLARPLQDLGDARAAGPGRRTA